MSRLRWKRPHGGKLGVCGYSVPRRLPLIILLWLAMANLGWAQSTLPLGTARPQVGATGEIGPPQQLPLISGSQDTASQIHRGPGGKVCLTVYGYAKHQTINPDLYDHVIDASNTCAQPIKLDVCYYHSAHCVRMNVPGYAHQGEILGIMPRIQDFRFEYRERFEDSPFGFATDAAE